MKKLIITEKVFEILESVQIEALETECYTADNVYRDVISYFFGGLDFDELGYAEKYIVSVIEKEQEVERD